MVSSKGQKDHVERMKVGVMKGEFREEVITESRVYCVNTCTEYIYQLQAGKIVGEKIVRGVRHA